MANLTTKDYIPEFTCIPARNPLVAKPAVSFVRRPPENGLGSQEQAAVSKAVVQLAAGARCHFSTRNSTLSVRTLTDVICDALTGPARSDSAPVLGVVCAFHWKTRH